MCRAGAAMNAHVVPDRALSLTQPFASLVVAGAKRVETRSWPTRHRGALAIHASKAFPRWAMELCAEPPFVAELLCAGFGSAAELPRGMIVGSVYVADCVPSTGMECDRLSDIERAFGDYTPGRFGWLLDDPVTYDPPVPCKGALGIWKFNPPSGGQP